MERSYTVHEIDAMRAAVENKYLWGFYSGPMARRGGSCSRSYQAADKAKVVEEQVRTHMLAGHTADDLLESEAGMREAMEKAAADAALQ